MLFAVVFYFDARNLAVLTFPAFHLLFGNATVKYCGFFYLAMF